MGLEGSAAVLLWVLSDWSTTPACAAVNGLGRSMSDEDEPSVLVQLSNAVENGRVEGIRLLLQATHANKSRCRGTALS